MLERLAELNALLNMDEKEEPEEIERKSIHDKLNEFKQNSTQMEGQEQQMKNKDIGLS